MLASSSTTRRCSGSRRPSSRRHSTPLPVRRLACDAGLMAEDRKPPRSADELLQRYAAGERDFRGANLRHADLGGANLRDANLLGAKLSDTDLRSANLSGAN